MRGFESDHPDLLIERAHAPVEEHRPQQLRAAAAGRGDVLGRAGMLALQRAAGNAAASTVVEEAESPARSPVLDVIGSSGSPLDSETRTDMESRIGADFGDVRVHTDDAAHRSAVAVNANAYTVGRNVVFQRDRYDPGSLQGRTTLAHELTHVVQQRSGPVDGTPAGNGVSVSSPSDRFEQAAAANAERVMSGPAPTAQLESAQPETGPGMSIQRDAGEEEEEVQGEFVQREGEEEEAVQGEFVQREQVQREDGEDEEQAG